VVRQWRVSELLKKANARADWATARQLYEQIVHMFPPGAPTGYLPPDLFDALAGCLSGIADDYVGDELRFLGHTLALIADVHDEVNLDDALFRKFYKHGPSRDPGHGRRALPTVVETVAETARRLRDARRLQEALAGLKTAGVLCGSTSYGPFYNVRGHRADARASDLDLMIVALDATVFPQIAARLSALEGLRPQAAEEFSLRAAIFAEQHDAETTVLSHKFPMWTEPEGITPECQDLHLGYDLSLHFLTRPTMDYVLVEANTTLTRSEIGRRRTVDDYRNTATDRLDKVLTFAGRPYEVQPTLKQVQGGWLRTMTAYQFDEADSYCPGFLQTALLPVLDVRWDELGWRAGLRSFARKFFERYREERARHSRARLLPSLTHVRRDVFAPHIIRTLDGRDC
jgi:hypothetical protein